MIANKVKSTCAYAKSCKKKQNKQQKPDDEHNKPEECLYDDLLNYLQMEDSQYIRKLCKKNQEKLGKQEQKGVNLKNNSLGRNSIKKNGCYPEYEQEDNHLYLSQKYFEAENQQIKMDLLQTNKRDKKFLKKQQYLSKTSNKIGQTSSCLDSERHIYKGKESNFIHNIDNYLSKLKPLESKKSSMQFRKTSEMKTHSKGESLSNKIEIKKYNILFEKWQEQVCMREHLEEKIQSDNIKMYKMKHIINHMMKEISCLHEQLDEQKTMRQRFQNISSQFIHQICNNNTNNAKKQRYTQGKQPVYLKKSDNGSLSSIKSHHSRQKHQKRYYLGNKDLTQDRFSHITKESFQYKENKNDYSMLKKRSTRHRYNMSQNYLDLSRQPFKQKVSIYNDLQ